MTDIEMSGHFMMVAHAFNPSTGDAEASLIYGVSFRTVKAT